MIEKILRTRVIQVWESGERSFLLHHTRIGLLLGKGLPRQTGIATIRAIPVVKLMSAQNRIHGKCIRFLRCQLHIPKSL